MPSRSMSGEGTRPLKEMFTPRQVPEQTAETAETADADKAAAAAAAREPTAALTDIPATAASTTGLTDGAETNAATPGSPHPAPTASRNTAKAITAAEMAAGTAAQDA